MYAGKNATVNKAGKRLLPKKLLSKSWPQPCGLILFLEMCIFLKTCGPVVRVARCKTSSVSVGGRAIIFATICWSSSNRVGDSKKLNKLRNEAGKVPQAALLLHEEYCTGFPPYWVWRHQHMAPSTTFPLFLSHHIQIAKYCKRMFCFIELFPSFERISERSDHSSRTVSRIPGM